MFKTHKQREKNLESLCGGLNATPFRTKARKSNHWAKGGLLELGSISNATYMHMKCSFYWQANLALGNVLWKVWRTLVKLYSFFFFFEIH